MGNVRVTASKKTTVLLLLVLFFIVGGTGGYLLWRVNQEKAVAPTDSEAGSDQVNNCCCDSPVGNCNGIRQCTYDRVCKEYSRVCTSPGICKPSGYCANGMDCEENEDCCMGWGNGECKVWENGPLNNGPKCTCTNGLGCCSGVSQCTCSSGSQCPACKWPLVAFCRSASGCTCIRYDADSSFAPGERCDDSKPCLSCPSGYGNSYVSDNCGANEKKVSGSCTCSPCGNPYTATICCKPLATNTCGDGTKAGSEACDPPGSPCTTASGKSSTCDSICTCPEPDNRCGDKIKAGSEACDPPGSACTTATGKSSTCSSTCTCPEPIVINKCDALNAKWVTKPATTIPYGQLIPFEYVTGDTDGVQNENIIVKIDGNSTSVTKIPATGNPTNITIKGSLNGSDGVLSPGTHKLEISWNDTKGAGGVPCYAYASFTVGAAPVNTCDALGAKWVKQPPTRVEYGKAIPFEYVTGDTDGVENVNILVKLDGTSIPVTKVPTTDNAVNITVKGTLNSDLTLASGSHKLEIAWNDVKGAGGVPCYAYSMINILPENPEWDIEKTAVETCENDWTENPISNLAYTITITNTNTGSGSGIITRIEDTLDPKVDPTKVANISNGGVLEGGKIVWTLTSPLSDFTPGTSKSFTYLVSVDKSAFGTYENNVIASTGGSEENSTLEASANIVASCNVPGEPGQPETGLFDDSKNIVLMGGILLFVGLGWSWITDSFSTLKHKMSYETKSRFEKRVSKR